MLNKMASTFKTARIRKVGFFDNRGFGVMEFIVALLLAGIVTSGAFALYLTQNKQWGVQDQVTDMQSSLRAAAAELTAKIRMAGYKVPDNIPPILAYNTNPDTIVIIYDSEDLRDVQLEHEMPSPSVELRCDGHDLTGLHDGDWAFIYDPNTRSGEFFLVTQIQYSDHIQHNTMPLSKAYPVGSKVYKLNRFKYYIDRTNLAHPNMMMQCWGWPAQVYAENITNLNFMYVLSSGTVVDVPNVAYMVREVRFNVDARSDKPDNEFQIPYRSRSLSSKVNVRNLSVN